MSARGPRAPGGVLASLGAKGIEEGRYFFR